MHVLFLSRRFFPAISGMSVYALNLVRQLRDMGHRVTMVTQYYAADQEGARVYGGGPPPPVKGVRVIGLEARGEQRGRFEDDVDEMAETIERLHAEDPFDVLHAQYAYPTGLAVLDAARRTGLPCVVSIQGGDGHWVGSCCDTHRDAMHAVLDHANALLIGCRSFADEVTERLGTDPDRFTIVPGAVEAQRFRPARPPGTLANPDAPTILYHGRVDARKGALDLIEAFETVASRVPTAWLVVSGIGPDLEAAQAAARSHPASSRIRFLGYADYASAPDVYGQGDVFASPTYAEGFSNTILEAMASGLAVASTRVVGVVDCVRHEENGLLADPGDVPAMAHLLEHLLVDDALRTRLAQAARDEVETTYAWPVVARQIEDVYRSLVGTAPSVAWSLRKGPPDACRFRAQPHLL
jgi:glycosyltransferase involved in cell wall biosynthesis